VKKVAIIICIGLVMASCGKYINFPLGNKYGLYRIKGPYFNYYNAYVNKGKVPAALGYPCQDSAVFINGTDTQYSFRVRLVNDFVLDRAISHEDQFTNIPFDEYCLGYNDSRNRTAFNEFIFSRIIDSDPFSEYYEVDDSTAEKYYTEYRKEYSVERARYFSLKKVSTEINEIILAGTLSEHFKKIK